MERLPRLEDLGDLAGKRVLMRADLNVPLQRGEISDDHRIHAVLPTIRWLQARDAQLTVCSHLGRPKGRPDPALVMRPVRRRLEELAPGVEVLENLRFDPGETANAPDFVDRLVDGHDMYVNEAFGSCHRAHASIVGPPSRLPSAAGPLLLREVDVLTTLRERPARPFVAILGGVKVDDKVGVIRALLDVVDTVLVGGAMCFTFLAAIGHHVGASPLDPDEVGECEMLLEEAGGRIHLPTDLVALGSAGRLFVPDAGGAVHLVWRDLPEGAIGADIGPATVAAFIDKILGARTVFWNGPLGAFEDDRFATGTRRVAQAVAESPAFTVAGGGDTAAALARFRLADRVDHLSTGGGAALELLEKGDLPGLAALRAAPKHASVAGSSLSA